MAKKPLSPAYAARIARGLARGLSIQAARGHAPKTPGKTEWRERVERVAARLGVEPPPLRVRKPAPATRSRKASSKPETRAQREVVSNPWNVTKSQRDTMRKWIGRRAEKFGVEARDAWEASKNYFIRMGFPGFEKFKEILGTWRNIYKRTGRSFMSKEMMRQYMRREMAFYFDFDDALIDAFVDEEMYMFFYH